MKFMYFRVLTVIFLFTLCFSISAQEKDTISGFLLHEVVVSDRAAVKEARSTTPLQILNTTDIENLNALQLSDAVKFFSGVTVKDYGGIGGLKTISVRSLGANHTAVGYDGISLSDCQSGQIDLSRFSLDNVESISLNAGQNDDIFQTARMFASASVLNVKTGKPEFSPGKNFHLKSVLKTGSFGLINPSVLLENKLSRTFSSTTNIEWLQANGEYPYTLTNGDHVSREKRNNSDVENLRLEAGLFGQFKNKQKLKAKAYYYQSERGLPGACIYYYDYSTQRLWEKNFFLQGGYEQGLSSRLSWQLNAKFNWSYQHYLDPDFPVKDKQNNHYYQWEYYLSSALNYQATQNLSFSWATDGAVNTMNADLPSFAYPRRLTGLSVLAGKFVTERVSLIADLLATFVNESVHYREEYQGVNYGEKGDDQQKLSPAISFSFQPLRSENLRLRLMYKEIFRMPTFNDLYYSRVGNPDLNPEYTWQYNAGITWHRKMASWFPQLSVTADCYYNKVNDKIIVTPGKDLFQWSAQNLGKVDIYGTDINLDMQFRPAEHYLLNVSGAFTLQKAWDVTSKTELPYSLSYKHQIPYTPEQSGSGRLSFQNPWVDVAYTYLWSAGRYILSQNSPANYLSGYTDQSISLHKRFQWKKTGWTAGLEILNLFDEQYEIVKSFPMPGRSWRATISIYL